MDYSYYRLLKKKTVQLLICCMVLLSPVFLFATHKPTTESTYGTFSGDYVIYRDYSWKEPTWIGFLYYNDETYGAFIRTGTHEKGRTLSLLFSGKTEKRQFVLTGQKIMTPITPDDTVKVNYLMTVLPKLYERKTFPAAEKALFGEATVQGHIEEFGGAVQLGFRSFIPLFHLHTLKNTKTGTILELAEIGSIKGSGESLFYSYTPEEPKQTKNLFFLNKNAKKETVYVANIPLHLDSQWKKIADNSFLCGNTAFLTITTVTIPVVKDINPLSAQEQLLRFFTASSPYAKALSSYTTITGTKEVFTVEQYIYDTKTKKTSKDIKQCIKNKDSSITVISLTVDSAAYNAEKVYFDSIAASTANIGSPR